MNIKKNIPNILSTIRLGMAITLPFVFFNTGLLNTLIYYLVADATDAVDGFLARRWKVQSTYGRKVDPLADKLLNGITLLLTSFFVNPIMFILAGFEAFIAATNLVRLKRGKDVMVEQIGRIKSVSLFFATVSALTVPLVPSLGAISNVLIGVTATLQAMTAHKYFKELSQEKKEAPKATLETIREEEEKGKQDEIAKLKNAKEKLSVLANKQTSKEDIYIDDSLKQLEQIKNEQIIYEQPEPFVDDEDKLDMKGISRTLKK